ncbi:MAG: adenylate/guanylate cyclase domain-containing protein [Roseobacter sp.]
MDKVSKGGPKGAGDDVPALEVARAREAATREVLAAISSSRDDEGPVFDAVLRKATELCETSFASLWLVSEDRERIYRAYNTLSFDQVATRRHGEEGNSHYRLMSDKESTLVKPLVDRAVFHVQDLRKLTRYSTGKSPNQKAVDTSGIRAVLSVPLMQNGCAIGTILLCRLEPRAFSDDQIKLVETFAEQAVIAIENVRQFKALEALNAELGARVQEQVGEIERIGRLKRFLPPAVADTVMASGEEELLRSHRAFLGVLFCDMRGFTAFCELATPEETIDVLKTYHREMGKLIAAHGAGVDHRMGDGIMVLFNDPLACEDPAGSAVRLAVAMREKMEELSLQWKQMGHRLGFGVGVSLGYATVGMVGYEDRSDYTASGTSINLASRLCDEARTGEILLSPHALAAVKEDYITETVGEISLKGMREPLEVFRLLEEKAR